ncbi:MAG TPA: deoxyribose-phosphate aldolase [Candidatus Acidoferrales bacterium]|nr:deoxyribose-phosphate aldolase [Candidatus Acidoferrales bacterium]
MTAAELARLIDHTLLKPEAAPDDVRRLCAEAREHQFASACVNPVYVPLAASLLADSPVKVCAVAGFPLGASLPGTKLVEARAAIRLGAGEIDMVIQIGALRGGDDAAVENEIRLLADACHERGALLKVILEMALLTREEKIRSATAAMNAGADFVKTSTGFGPGGATVDDVALLRSVVGTRLGVKAAGGIRSLDDLERMVAAGATRIGTSSGARILAEFRARSSPAPRHGS